MNNHKQSKADPLAALLKEQMVDIPTAEFTDKLLHASMSSYRLSYSKTYQKEERLGKAIISILLFFNLLMLYLLQPFGATPILLSGMLAIAICVISFVKIYLKALRRALNTSRF